MAEPGMAQPGVIPRARVRRMPVIYLAESQSMAGQLSPGGRLQGVLDSRGSSTPRRSLPCKQCLQLLFQQRHHFEKVTDNSVGGHFEDGRLGILVDGDDDF